MCHCGAAVECRLDARDESPVTTSPHTLVRVPQARLPDGLFYEGEAPAVSGEIPRDRGDFDKTANLLQEQRGNSLCVQLQVRV